MAETDSAKEKPIENTVKEPGWLSDGKWLAGTYIEQLGMDEKNQKEANEGISEILTVGHPDYKQPEPKKRSAQEAKVIIDQIAAGDFSSVDVAWLSPTDLLMFQAARDALKEHRDLLKQHGFTFGDEKEDEK